jgi:hypothetical protein
MKFTFEIEAEDFTSARALLITALGSEDAPAAAAPPKAPKAPKAAAPPAEENQSDHTYEVVSAKVQEVSKLKGREVAINLLGQFKQEDGSPATKGAQLQPKDYDDFMEKAAEALEDIG